MGHRGVRASRHTLAVRQQHARCAASAGGAQGGPQRPRAAAGSPRRPVSYAGQTGAGEAEDGVVVCALRDTRCQCGSTISAAQRARGRARACHRDRAPRRADSSAPYPSLGWRVLGRQRGAPWPARWQARASRVAAPRPLRSGRRRGPGRATGTTRRGGRAVATRILCWAGGCWSGRVGCRGLHASEGTLLA